MNFDEMKKMMNMIDSMNGKSPLDIISENNPRMAQMQNVLKNPTQMLSNMGGMENLGNFGGANGADMASMLQMASQMRKNTPRETPQSYYGLTPIAGFAPPEIVYELNRYLSK